jgi:CubicO group peptidase (beta-lactamase class C family)
MRDQEADEYARKVEGTAPPPEPEPTQHPELARYLSRRYAAPLWKAPGQEMSYCNYGYNLLGEVVRRVSGQPVADFASKRIFEPLGMKDTSYCLPVSRADRAAVPTDPAMLPIMEYWWQVPYPCGAVLTTAMELATFAQMLLNGGLYGGIRILAPCTVAAMARNQIPGIGARYGEEVIQEACWGLGWSVFAGSKGTRWALGLASASAFCQGGAGGAFVWVDPGYDLVGVYLPAQDTSRTLSRYDFATSTRHFFGAYQFADVVTAAIVDTKGGG